jgi:hypothetical protein
MAVQEKTRWKDWADSLRQEMMGSLTSSVTKSVEEIAEEVATTKAENTWRSERFWRSCQNGTSPNDVLKTAGFELEFEPGENRCVEEVTLSLNSTWMAILQRVLDRQRA